jgi:hypothetical protein
MPVKMPTAISSKWWKENIPSHFPRDKGLETQIKAVETFNLAQYEKDLLAELAKIADGNSMPSKLKTEGPKLAELVKSLDHFAGLLIKDKHAEIAKGVKTMSALAEKMQDKVTAVSEAATAAWNKKSGVDSSRGESHLMTLAEGANKTVKLATAAIKRLSNGAAAAAADRDALGKAIGQNRYIQGELKTLRMKITKLESQHKAELAHPDGSDVRLLLKAATNGANKQLEAAVAVDKVLLKAAVDLIGLKEARDFFLKTPASPVKLT